MFFSSCFVNSDDDDDEEPHRQEVTSPITEPNTKNLKVTCTVYTEFPLGLTDTEVPPPSETDLPRFCVVDVKEDPRFLQTSKGPQEGQDQKGE